jgi:hypothetical protein
VSIQSCASPHPRRFHTCCTAGESIRTRAAQSCFEFYFKYKRATRSRLRTGDHRHRRHADSATPDIDFRGFVCKEEKFELMAGASVFVIPSPNESFSIVTLEAMAQRTPVLASAVSEVMVDHIQRSRAGSTYSDYPSFAAALDMMLGSASRRLEMGRRGREYVVANYTVEAIQNRLNDLIVAQPDSFAGMQFSGSPSVEPVAGAVTSTIVRNGPGENSSHMMTLKLGNQLNQVSLDAHELGNGYLRIEYSFVR